MSETPEKIGKYEIVEEVGRGSMGTVYAAHDPFSDRLVAIKLAHPQFVDQSEAGRRFRKLFFNEAHATGTLDHPNLLKVLDADVDGDLCYLVMEFIEGAQTLGHYVKPDRVLSLREVVGIEKGATTWTACKRAGDLAKWAICREPDAQQVLLQRRTYH